MPDARCTRGLVCKIVQRMRTRAYRAAEAIRHSLRNGFTAYTRSPRSIGLSCLRRLAETGTSARSGFPHLRKT
jgi:hypothetical protein